MEERWEERRREGGRVRRTDGERDGTLFKTISFNRFIGTSVTHITIPNLASMINIGTSQFRIMLVVGNLSILCRNGWPTQMDVEH